jgi:hypothetical protein
VRIKFGIKTWSLLASAAFSLVLVAGCNTEEAAPAKPGPTTAPVARPSDKPATAPVTTAKPAEKPDAKKP